MPTRGGAVCCDPKIFPWGPIDQRPVEKRKDVLVYTSAPYRGLDVLLAAYARSFMSFQLIGEINIGLVLGLLQFVSTAVITV